MKTDTAATLDTTWVVDPDRSILGFTIAHLAVANVKGHFGTFAGTLAADGGVLRATGSVDAATIDTGNAVRDRRLRGPEFFDVALHPEIRFASRHIERFHAGTLRIAGDLTIKGAMRRVELDGRVLRAPADRLELLVTGELNRAEFGIESLELSAAGVSNRVKVLAMLSLAR